MFGTHVSFVPVFQGLTHLETFWCERFDRPVHLEMDPLVRSYAILYG